MKILAAFTAGAAVLLGAQAASGFPLVKQEENTARIDPHTVKLEQQNLTLQTRLVRARALLRKARRKASRRAAELHAALEASTEGYARAVMRVCIHPKEADWQDSGAPFWGGMQMDLGFQRTYGGPLLAALGTADHWPIAAQLAVSEVAYYAGRGFGPWPNTRRGCG